MRACNWPEKAQSMEIWKEKRLSVLVDFQGPMLPKYVTIGYLHFNERMCPPDSRILVICKGIQTCGRCGGEQDYRTCGSGVPEKCINCGGSHSVGYRKCPARKRAVEIQHTGAERKLSYTEAAKRVCAEPNLIRQDPKTIANDEEFLRVKKKECVCFIVEGINCMSQAKHKSEKAVVVVKSATKYLGIKGIAWESIYEELKK